MNIWFSDDGSLSGFGGCTLYSGTFELRADAIHIQDIAGGGGSGCEQSDADFEAAFLAILPYVSRMSFDGADLVLWSADQPIRFRSR